MSVNSSSRGAHAEASSRSLHERFHEAYADARAGTNADPALVVLASSLTLCLGNERRKTPLDDSQFDILKATAHGPIALFALLASSTTDILEPSLAAALTRCRRALDETLPSLALLDLQARTDASAAVRMSIDFIDRLLRKEVSATHADEYAARVGPLLLQLTAQATARRLSVLTRAADNVLAPLTASQRSGLRVVVTGDHQARVRSLAIQYFQKRLLPTAEGEERVVYGESINDVESAVLLLATQRIDRRIARAFFGDANRLQRDILGDAAAKLLEGYSLPAIG